MVHVLNLFHALCLLLVGNPSPEIIRIQIIGVSVGDHIINIVPDKTLFIFRPSWINIFNEVVDCPLKCLILRGKIGVTHPPQVIEGNF